MHRHHRFGLLVLSLLVSAAGMTSRGGQCADVKPAARGAAAVEYPLGLVAFASVDRLRARADSLGEAWGQPGDGQNLLVWCTGGDDGLASLLNCPGLDTTKPFGVMSYPNWFGDAGEVDASDGQESGTSRFADDPIGFLPEKLMTMFIENATVVLCIPAKDRQQLLASIRELIGKDEALADAEGQSGWYQIGEDGDTRLGFVGNYLLVVVDNGEVKHFDRNYPEFEKLAKGSLGKNGFVYSLYRRGLPAVVRDGMVPAFKLAFAAGFQRRDDEPEADFRLRTMFGPLQTELLDVALSHIDEFRITGHVDSATRLIFVEPELVGPKDGKFAKFCNGLNAKNGPFASMSHDHGVISAAVSLPLPQIFWNPVFEALHGSAQSIGQPETAEMLRTLARTVESGQLDLFLMSPNWNEGLFALRVAGNAKFPGQFQEMLAKVSGPSDFQPEVDSVGGFPIHRSSMMTGLDIQGFLELLFRGQIGFVTTPVQVIQLIDDVEVAVEVTRDEAANEGKPKVTTGKFTMKKPDVKNSIWIAATPQTIWLGLSSSTSEECPEWFKSQISSSLAKPTGTAAASRNKSVFQFTMRGLGASSSTIDAADPNAPKLEIQPVAGTSRPDDGVKQEVSEQEQARGDILRDLPNAIRCELRPFHTGLKLSIAFEEAYFHWFATLAKDSMDASKAARQSVPADAKGADANPSPEGATGK